MAFKIYIVPSFLLEEKLTDLLERVENANSLARRAGYEPEVISRDELLNYISGESYEPDLLNSEEILSDELLLLHEIVEISELKRMGFTIDSKTIMRAYPHTYEAHLTAMEVELRVASLIGRREHILKRIIDLKNYLKDEYLPGFLRKRVLELISLAESL